MCDGEKGIKEGFMKGVAFKLVLKYGWDFDRWRCEVGTGQQGHGLLGSEMGH